jgi:hypothetical protein
LDEGVFVSVKLSDKLLEFLSSFCLSVLWIVFKSLTYRLDNEPIFEVLSAKSSFLFNMLSDSLHNLAETVLIHNCYL